MTEEQTHIKSQLISEDKCRTNSIASLSSSGVSDEVPEVAFAPSSNNGSTIGSPRVNRENQPLLGRMESDVTFNNFPGKYRGKLRCFLEFNVNDKAIKLEASVLSHVVDVCIGALFCLHVPHQLVLTAGMLPY